jgi:uroporphyrinogen-III synthase
MSNFSIFISRNQEDISELHTLCLRQNLKLISNSLIEFVETSFRISENWDVIFFPSPRAVDFFFRQDFRLDLSIKKIACAGKGTALALQKWVNKVDFLPKHPGKINEVQIEFAKWLEDRKVLFVGSNQSKKSVLLTISPIQYEFVQIYETRFKLEKIAPCQLYVFSSPSNVKSFIESNKFPYNFQVISWGQSTTNELIKNGIIPVYELKSGELSELIQYLKENLIV